MELLTKKVVRHGIAGRIFVCFSGVEVESDLPKEYLSSNPHCYCGEDDKNEHIIFISEGVNIVCHSTVFYSEDSYQYILKLLRECGENLAKITKQKKMSWYGEEKVTI